MLAVLIALQGVLALLRLRSSLSWQETSRLGVAGGLLPLTQPSLIPFLLVIGLFFLPSYGPRRFLHLGARSIPIAVAILVPWWLRNYLVLGTFVPFTTASGYSNLVAVTGSLDVFGHMQRHGEVEGARSASAAAWSMLASDPLQVLYQRVSAYGQSFAIDNWAAVRLRFVGLADPTLALLVPTFQLFYAGAWAAAARGQQSGVLPLLLLVALANLLLFGLPFEFSERHRYVLMPFLFLLAAAAWQRREAAALQAPL